MNNIYEALKGFTDIPSAVVALVLGLLALRRRDREGAALFLIIAAGGFLGSAVHIFELPELIRRIVWVFLHMALFEAVLRFTLLFNSFLSGGRKSRAKQFRFLEVVLYFGAVAAVLACGRRDMLFFIAFSAVCMVQLIICMIKADKKPKRALVLITFIPLLLILQTFSKIIPYSVVFEHAIITMILFIIYSMSAALQSAGNA